jgi:uncharacterized DUF497 family protein
MPLRFEWDLAKAKANEAKHGVTFEEATTAFGDPLSLTIPDPEHSHGEQRYILLGQTFRGKLVVVVHAEQDEGTIRLVSARPATRNERKYYEET